MGGPLPSVVPTGAAGVADVKYLPPSQPETPNKVILAQIFRANIENVLYNPLCDKIMLNKGGDITTYY